MKHEIKISLFLGVLSVAPLHSVLGGEPMKDLPGNTKETTTGSLEPYALEGKLLNVDGEFWVMEDRSGNQHRLHIGAETTLPQASKQPGDSIHAVINQDGQALIIR
ncbi:MAG: hypothetical protein OEZ57_00880 [Nitrospirota bacterium]|nr:hypothetical protein [Nitrospirota bacterium]MDH5585507.1 hypothetical protein [Nitrospirota bacterium]MDH5773452.1 hypothetical protein [Nitrospirota bacterium]